MSSPQNARFAIFNPATMGDDLEITNGGLVLTTNIPALDINRTARLSVAAQDYESFIQFMVFGLQGTDISNKVSIGLVTSDADLDTYVGGDEFGIGYRVGDGQIRHDGSSVASVTTGALFNVISVRYIPGEAGAGQVAFYRGTTLLSAQPIPAEMEGQPLFPAVSVGSTADAGDISVYANAGRDWYWAEVDAAPIGWWEVNALPGTLRFSNKPFISPPTDTDPFERWEGGITSDLVKDDRGVHFWIWGRGESQARGSAAVVEVLDEEGILNNALGGVYRDQPASLRLLPDGTDSFDDANPLGNFIIDNIIATDLLKRRVTLKGPLSAFEVPMLRLPVKPDADPDAFGNYYPMLIGPAFSCPVRLLKQADRIYAVDAVGTNAISKVRDSGRALDFSLGDWELLPPGREIEVANEPFGTITADAAGTGVNYTPPGEPDVIDNDGNPFVGDVDDFPIGFTLIDAGGTVEPNVSPSFAGSLLLYATEGNTGRLKHSTAVFTAGKTYRISIRIYLIRQHGSGGIPVIVGLGKSETGYENPLWQANGRIIGTTGIVVGGVTYSTPRTFEFFYTPSTTHSVIIYWRDYADNDPGSLISAAIQNLTIVQMPDPEDENEDDADAALAQLARPLEDMLRQGIEERCGLSPDVWASESAAMVDAITGYLGQGYFARDQVVLRDYIEDLLAPYLASAFESRDGKLKIARLVDPEDVDVEASPVYAPIGPDIEGSDILNEPVPIWDDMKGLTCSIGCRKNEHVFTMDELLDDVPFAARPKLTKPYRYVRRYGGPLAAGLEHARAAPTLDSRLVIPDDAQAAIDHAGYIARVPRAFFRLEVIDPSRWEVGEVCRMYLPKWIKDNGGWRNVFITRIEDGRKEKGFITVWTRAPWEE